MKQDNWEGVLTAGIEDVDSLASLNNQIYPKEWHVPASYIKEIMLRNPEVYRIYKSLDGVKGIYGFLPLSQADYNAVLEGKLEETEIGYVILDYKNPKPVYLYLVTIIVDVHDPRRKEYARKLIKDIPVQLMRLKEKGIEIKEIGAFAVSAEGEGILPKIGFRQFGETVKLDDREYPVFRAKPEEVMEKIEV